MTTLINPFQQHEETSNSEESTKEEEEEEEMVSSKMEEINNQLESVETTIILESRSKRIRKPSAKRKETEDMKLHQEEQKTKTNNRKNDENREDSNERKEMKEIKEIEKEESYESGCNCSDPFDTSKPMIQCDNCEKWVHGECTNFHCQNCVQQLDDDELAYYQEALKKKDDEKVKIKELLNRKIKILEET